jgi:hypothetical protein
MTLEEIVKDLEANPSKELWVDRGWKRADHPFVRHPPVWTSYGGSSTGAGLKWGLLTWQDDILHMGTAWDMFTVEENTPNRIRIAFHDMW